MVTLKQGFWLLGVNLFISAFTFGGGYVVIPMIRKAFVTRRGLFSEEELTTMAALAQSSPGAIAVNLSMLAGYRVAGLAGAVMSCVGALAPPIVILSLVSLCYQAFRDNQAVSAALRGMEAGVAAVIADLVIDMCRNIFGKQRLFASLLVPLVFFASFILHINVALILIACAIAALAEAWLRQRCGKQAEG